VLDVTKSPALGAINVGAGAPVGAVGTLVSSLVDLAVPSGQVDNVTDADSGAVLGIAVTAANSTNGTWWYSTNNGGNWLALGAVSDANARLLAADGATRLYFQPNVTYDGSIADAITFRAWDRTTGSNGATADTTVNGGKSAFSTATDTASLVVSAVNDAPTTSPVTLAAIAEDSGPRLITSAELVASANDIDGDPLTVAGLVIASGSGSLVNNGNGTWTYTPAANDNSAVSFTYTINDGQGGSVAGSATLDITPVKDAPTTSPVTLAAIAEDSARTITAGELLANATDADGDPLTVAGLAIASGNGSLVDNGNGTWTYTPAADDDSTVSFSYTINDGQGGSVAGSATLDITPVNDAPTTSPVTLAAIAEDSGARLITSAELLANAADVDGDPLTVAGLAIAGGAGSLVDNGNGTWTYTPAANDDTSVSFSYTIDDGQGGSVAGSATLDITPVNDAPTTSPVTLAAIAEDSGARLITSAELLANAADADGDPLTVAGVAIASGSGSLVNNGNGTWTYTPAANDSSSVSFSYTINDGQGGSVAGSATLDITPVNHAPTITSDGGGASAALSTAENTSAATLVTSVDVDGDAVAYSIAGGSDAGQFKIDSATGALTFSSPPNYEAPRDSDGDNVYQVIVRAADGQGGAVTQTLSITITNVDEAPAVGGDSFSDASEQQLIIGATQLLANDQDPEGSALQIVSVSSPINGTLQQDSAGSWLYTPLAGFAGSDQFTYTVADASGHSSAGQVVILVTASAPVATTDPTPPPAVAPAPATTGTAGSPSAGGPQGTPGMQLGGGGPVLPASDPSLGLPVDLRGSEASTATLSPAEVAASAGVADVSRANFIAFEDARVENPRSWTPSNQFELEEITASMNSTEGQMLMLARSEAQVDSSRSLAVVDESYEQLLGPAGRTSRGVAEIVMGSSLAFSAGLVAWLLRGGALAASLLSVLPAWVAFDPVPILVRRRERKPKPGAVTPPEDPGETAVTRVLRPDARSPRADRS
ncbi:MAG TPA: cadherin-like domain-containing protein, partial [Gammaproteobacteria bacterium]|nr:cadherin-like domain-containing protein [Gammaproteobacteria bacterium]